MQGKRKPIRRVRAKSVSKNAVPVFDHAAMSDIPSMLADTEKALLHSDDVAEMYRIVTKAVHTLLGVAVTATSSLDTSTNSMRFVAAEGLPVAIQKIIQVLGIDPTATTKRVDEMTEGELRHYLSGRLEKVEDGLFGLLKGYVPRSVCAVAQKLLNVQFVHAIGFVQGDMHLGALFILSPEDCAPYRESIERIVSQAAFIIQRKRAEDELRQSREQLRLVISGSGVGIWDWYVQSGVVIFNERWAGMLGYTLKELAPVSIDTWKRLTHPVDLEMSTALLEKHFSGKSPIYECEMRMKHKDGHWVWILDRGSVAKWDENGKPLRMTGTHLDISDRKNAEIELYKRAYELEFLSLTAMGFVNLAPDDDIHAFIADKLQAMLPDFRIIVNEFSEKDSAATVACVKVPEGMFAAAMKILGRSPKGMRFPITDEKRLEMLDQRIVSGPRGIFDISAGVLPKPVCDALDVLLDIGTIYGMGFATENMLMGNVVLISPKGVVLERPAFVEGFIKQAAVALQKRRAERSLAESESRYRGIFENIQDVYYESSIDGVLLEISPSVERLTRYTRTEIIGKPIASFYLRSEDYSRMRTLLFTHGTLTNQEITLKDSDGTPIDCSLSVSAIVDGQKRPIKISGTIRDISERKRTEAMLVQSDKLRSLGVLASGVAHEINQPLMALSLATDNVRAVLASGAVEAEYVRKKMDAMQGYILRAKNIIEQVRMFSRDQSQAEIEPFSISDAVDNVLSMVETQYKSRGIRIVRDGGAAPLVQGNIYKFEQVIVNLLSNARDAIDLKAAHDSGFTDRVIAIRISHADGMVRLTVRDNGSGMSEQARKNIFTPFYTTKPTGAGTGLGLSITYGIVKAMGGDIMFESAEGEYTAVTVSVPAIQ